MAEQQEQCPHENLEVSKDYEGYGPGEPHLTRYFTRYYCPDCDYDAEWPPEGWEPDFNEPEPEPFPPDEYYP